MYVGYRLSKTKTFIKKINYAIDIGCKLNDMENQWIVI